MSQPTPQPGDTTGAEAGPERPAALSRAVRATSGMTLLSRFGGLLRELLTVRIFQDSAVGSAFQAAFAVPNLFRRLFGEGALSAAFIPEYARTDTTDRPLAAELARLTLLVLALVTSGITLVIEAGLLVVIAAGVRTGADGELAVRLVMVMLPYMPLVCVTAILSGMLQVHGRYAAAGAGPVVLNAFIVVTGLYFWLTGAQGDASVAYAIGIVAVLAGAVQLAYSLHALRTSVAWKAGAEARKRLRPAARSRARAMLVTMIPVLIGTGTLQLNAFLDTLLAMWPVWVGPTMFGQTFPMDEKSNMVLVATQRLYQFPLGVFGIAVATAVFPLLAKEAADREGFVRTLRHGVRLSLFIGLPASVGLVLVREPLTYTFFASGGGGFSADGVARSARVLAGYGVAVWAYSLAHVLTRAFYARRDTATPLKVSLFCMGLNIALNLALIWRLHEAGLAWATAATSTVQCVLLAGVLSRRLGEGAEGTGGWGRLIERGTLAGVARTVVSTLAMGAAVSGMFWALPTGMPRPMTLAAACLTGGIVYAIAANALRQDELSWLVRRSPREESGPV